MQALDPAVVVAGHRLPETPNDVSAIEYTRDYLATFESLVAQSPDGAAVTAALVEHYPDWAC